MSEKSAGTLYLVATPIGNLSDMSFRAVEVLKNADLIAAEDTRHSKILLDSYGITTPVTSYHEHNKYEKAELLAGEILGGKDVACITDAGTPAISDPGEILAKMCRDKGIKVTSVPGACALITALTISGMPARRFVFEGFLPAEKPEAEKVLESLKNEQRTIIMYEAPHRLKKTLKTLFTALGDRQITICRELTKIHEEAVTYSLSEAVGFYENNEARGEYVLVIAGKDAGEAAAEAALVWEKMSLSEHLKIYTDKGIDKKEAMKCVASDRGITKRDVYKALLDEEEK